MGIDVITRVAVHVFKESVRDRVLYNLVVFAVLLIGASYVLGQLTAGQEVKIIKDLGLAAVALFGLFIAVFIGVGLVSKEVDRRSIYVVLAKPLTRRQFVAGKYLGLVMTLAVNVALMALALYLVLGYMSWIEAEEFKRGWEAPATDPAMLKALLLIFVQLMLVTAVALFFSTFTTPVFATVFTLGLFVAGHFNADLRAFESVLDHPVPVALARAAYHVVPDLSSFDIKAEVVHAQPVPWGYLALTSGYGLLYVALLVVSAMLIFDRRDFK